MSELLANVFNEIISALAREVILSLFDQIVKFSQ